MIETAKKHVTNNLLFLRMDINDLNYTNEFDVIFSNATLHWVRNHEKLLQNCFVALKPNGRILWNFGGSGNCANFYEVIRKTIKEDKYKEYFLDFTWLGSCHQNRNMKNWSSKSVFPKSKLQKKMPTDILQTLMK